MDLIEHVARAIRAELIRQDGGCGGVADANGHIDIPNCDDAALARAAIEAMREPTQAMVGGAMIQPHPSVADAGGIIEQGRAAIRIDYQAMIDAALATEPVW